MAFEYEKPAGEWINMRDLVKIGAVLEVGNGFLVDDPTNEFKGEASPRFIIQATEKTTGDAVKVSCPKGYGRDGFFTALDAYLKEHDGENVSIKFVTVSGSNYIDVDVA